MWFGGLWEVGDLTHPFSPVQNLCSLHVLCKKSSAKSTLRVLHTAVSGTEAGCERLGVMLPVLRAARPLSTVLSAYPKDAHHGLRALSWGICMPCNGHLLGVDHEATPGCHEIQGVPGSNDNYNWGEAVSQQLTRLSLLPCLQGGAALTAQPMLVCTQLSDISAWQCHSTVSPLSSSPLPAAQKVSWPFPRQCCVCLGEGSLGRVDKKALCEGRDGAELTLCGRRG